jgi:3-phosphoshikimate 1-carboxyvinyltransferase
MSLRAEPAAGPLKGELRPPGDKSISHRALIFGGLADGTTHISGLLESADTTATRRAMEQLGAQFSRSRDGWQVCGLGSSGLQAPVEPLDMGNSGTAMRLLAGVLSAQPFASVLTGDASLNSRPMGRVIKPLELMGARIKSRPGQLAPLHIEGSPGLRGITYASPVASAQVKSCVLLAGLFASGTTRVSEPHLSRDHTERMLPLFGVQMGEGISLQGPQALQAARVDVPADPSSAAFPAVAALLVPGSDILLRRVGMNPTRAALFEVLKLMGADIQLAESGQPGLEPLADVRVRYSGALRGVDVPPEWVPAMIDEVPVLLALAALASGVTRIRGAAELRVKESDRLAVMARGLEALGIDVQEYPDGIDVHGGQPRSARVEAANDHRCAMSFAVLGQCTPGGIDIGGADYIDTSYPGFISDMRSLGAQLHKVSG